jgi:hypothetical protein
VEGVELLDADQRGVGDARFVTVGGEVLEQARTYRAGLYAGDDPDSGINVAMYLGGT